MSARTDAHYCSSSFFCSRLGLWKTHFFFVGQLENAFFFCRPGPLKKLPLICLPDPLEKSSLVCRAAYLGTLKRIKLLAKTYVVKRFGEECDFMAHAYIVLFCFARLQHVGLVWSYGLCLLRGNRMIVILWNGTSEIKTNSKKSPCNSRNQESACQMFSHVIRQEYIARI